MFSKAVALLAIVAVANCQYLHGAHVGAVGAQAEHTVRGFGGLSTVSHQSKAVVSPYSSVQKTDTRLTNDLAYAHHGYAAPAYAHGYAAPALAHHGYAAPALAHGYAAPALAHHGYAAPALAHHGYAAPALAHHGYAAPALAHGYAAPALAHHGYAATALAHHGYAHGYAAPLAAKAVATNGLLGHAYSSVPAVASHTFTRTYGHGTLAYGY